MGYRINWYGPEAMAASSAQAWKRVYAAGLYLKSRIQRNVSIPTAAVGPSKPGEYPHVVTGMLRKSIFLRPRQSELAIDVGTKLVYGIHWEMTNRPYIRRTFAEELGTIRAILEGKAVRTTEDIKAEAGEMKQRRLGWRESSKQRSKAAREAKQAKRERSKERGKERKTEAKAVKTRQMKRATEGKRFWTKRAKEIEKRAAAAEKKGRVKQAEKLRAAREKATEKASRAESRRSWYKDKGSK